MSLSRRTAPADPVRKRTKKALQQLLDEQAQQYNRPAFIINDPISIPHQFSRLQDREIMGFWTAMLSWGQRTTIIQKSQLLIQLMDGAPYDFIRSSREEDLKRFSGFVHRTFNYTDTLYFLHFFRKWYAEHESLEDAFLCKGYAELPHVEKMLTHFHEVFFNDPYAPARTRKHVPTPASKSACKRLNMFLRWMVRSDNSGVDLGVWKQIQPHQLVCPLDVHVERVARKLGLLERKQADWLAALELTDNLRTFDPKDPVRYDFALFGMGLSEKQLNR